METNDFIHILTDKGLKITPQRLAVLDALRRLHNHPTPEQVCRMIKSSHPHIAIGTVYKTLETFVEKGILKKVKTDGDVMRYDDVTHCHHHLYCADSQRIEDYFDDELNTLLDDYFKRKQIPNFNVDEVRLHINGRFVGE